MAEYREVFHDRLYLKEPRSDRLRKSAAGHLRHLLAAGWKEVERWHADDYITVRMERSGHAPRMTRLPKIEAPPPRPPRQRSGQGPGGPRR
ncbi:MAG TPA: hypothetical protein VF972_12385 [Actinomycetota bacterium]